MRATDTDILMLSRCNRLFLLNSEKSTYFLHLQGLPLHKPLHLPKLNLIQESTPKSEKPISSSLRGGRE